MTKKVAIIGFSSRLPGSHANQFWQDLLDGRDLITEVDSNRWAKDAFSHPNKNHPGTSYTFAAGSIGDISTFDAGFFGISPRESSLMDPQQLLLLEMSWEALENSGIKPSTLRGSQCGVFIGIAASTADHAYRLADDLAAVNSLTATGNAASIAANRISYILDLRGPSMVIDTACSSSMVAFHQACNSILLGESSQAITGGINLHLHPYGFIIFTKASMLSPRGKCNPFDASADGYVRSEGGGIFFLKDYDQAVADGNPILAIVANSAINTDGFKSSLTVPNHRAQAALLEKVYFQAGIDPLDIDYIEAHGTGTAVGDPVEVQAIGDALGKLRLPNKPLLIGSVKSNLGHLEVASGVAGLVKALYCIQHRLVPATIGIKTLNPSIPFEALHIKVVNKNQALKSTGKLIIGVNSFGFGGANAHVILESHEALKQSPPEHGNTTLLPLVISAKDTLALKEAALDFSLFLSTQAESSLYDIAYNAVFNREWHEHRAIVYGTTAKTIAEALLHYVNDEQGQCLVESGTALTTPYGPAFIYSGNGSQWAGMGKLLLEEDPLFRDTIREIDVFFSRHADFSIEDELAGKNGEDRYQYTEIAQPALFALQVGITRMLEHQGIMPVAVAGHSVGEVAAAWASGALTLEAAVQVIYHRSELQGTTKGKGEMTAVALSQVSAQTLLNELDLASTLSIAGINSSNGVTIAGSPQSLTCLESTLNKSNIFNKRLDLDYAFHSPIMDEIESGLRLSLAELHPNKTLIPFYSTVTGALLEGTELDAAYWWYNIRKPVLFEQAINNILKNDINIFIEIGPHAVLRSYINDCVRSVGTESRILSTITRNDDAPQRVLDACSQALIAGVNSDWSDVFSRPGQFIQLPNYPWQREHYWHPVTPESIGLLYRHKIHPLLGYPLQQHELTWENQLDTKLNPSLADHVVGGAIVFPGAGFSELALAATLAWYPGELAEIEKLEIHSPLLLSTEHTKVVRLKITPQDGSLTIAAREHNDSKPWTIHAVGRILKEPKDTLLQQESLLLPIEPPYFNGVSHKELTDANGLTYGPAFQCIDYGWVKCNSVLAVLKIPESIEVELAHTHLHPALLDCTFQLIFQLLKDHFGAHAGITFVPTKMDRIVFRSSKAKPGFARATLLRQSQRSLTTEFTIFDTDRIAIAVIKGVQFRSIRLSINTVEHLHFLAYHSTPRPLKFRSDASSVISFETVKLAIDNLAKQTTFKGIYRRYTEEVEPLIDSLCSRFTQEAISLLSANGKELSIQDILAYQNTNPEIAPFLSHLLTVAQEDQVIPLCHDSWDILPNEDTYVSAQDIWNSLLADYPDYFQIIHSVGRIGMHLKSLLKGSLTFDKICPQESSLPTLTCQVLGAKSLQNIGLVLRDLMTKGIEKLPEGQRFGLIEISEGTASFVIDACIAMDFTCCDYIFASTSATTLEATTQIKEQFPGIITHLIAHSTEQVNVVATCQIAIITLDFSTLEYAISALEYARASLLSGGTLIVIANQPARWIDFVFGGQRDYWQQSKDDSWLSNQHTALFWKLLLQQLNFSNIENFELAPNTFSGPYLLVAQRDENIQPLISPLPEITPRSWIILADKIGYSAQLSNRLSTELQMRGDLVIQTTAGDTNSIESLLLETRGNYGEIDGIVQLAGLTPQSNLAEVEVIIEQQVIRCASAANIIQACENTQTNTNYWIITSGAITHLLPKRSSSKTSTSSFICMDAALWGFGRSLINEASTTHVRLIDLESPLLIDTVVSSLANEFASPDDEQEIILTGCGARYVPRLHLEPEPDSQEHQEIESPTINLGFEFPGQLRNLRWEAQPRRTVSEGEIEVEVHASGLNFRDVMYALGLLSDEAIENGFSGPTLGLEFSGIVQAIGSKTNEFSVGDRVVGFGPSSFGNRVITKANVIALIPSSISFEAAATIPSTFFTVYYALHHLARLQPGEKILIHGAAGGVGIAAIQIAKWMGAEIYATAGSDEKRDFLKLLGIEHIFDSRSLTFADEIMAQTDGQGIDVILNSLAGEAINRNFQILKPFGRFLELGKRDFYENTKIGLRPFRNNISYFGVDADQLLQLHSGLTYRLFTELMALFSEGILQPLPYQAFEADNIIDAFRYMQQARQIGKIVITYRNGINHIYSPSQKSQKHLALSANASYLVTGGLSGFGLKTAQWLANKGARCLVLISLSGPSSEEAKTAIELLEQQGVTVYATACDVTDKKAISALFTEIANTLPPLKGLVHAATVINDGLIRNMDAHQIRSVLEPKALGAYYLHEMTLATSLDFFVLFSSATTLFGNPGQANYVAANTCLEALALQRRTKGLPATCVAWGAIDDVGYLARNKKIKDALQNRMGGVALNSDSALDILEKMLLSDYSNLGVMDLDWQTLSKFLPSADSPKFIELTQHNSDDDRQHDSATDIQQLLLELSNADLLTALIEMIKSDVSEILRISPDKIDSRKSIYDMGLDSLMGVELIVALESRFSIRLPVMALSESPTITKLTERIIEQLKGNSEQETDSDKTELLTRTQQIIAQHVTDDSSQLITNLVNNLQSQNATIPDRIIN